MAVDDIEFEIPTLMALAAMKRDTGRGKDLIDLAELNALSGSDEEPR